MSLFDPASLPRTPPPQRSTVRCGQISSTLPARWDVQRQPCCNRPAGHDGPHREIRRRDFKVLHEWEPVT